MLLLLFASRMPPKRPDDIHRTISSRQSDGKGEASRHGSMGGTSRSPKLEVSFLLNQSQSGSPSSVNPGVSAERSSGGPTSRRQDRRSQSSSGSGQKRYACPSCPATFAQSHDALKHQRTVHEKLRPFKCDVCGKHFGEKGNLSKHKKSVHLNERPFSCEYCSSSFAFKDGLQRHRSLVHHDLRPFSCRQCGASFKQISQLRKHSCHPSGSSSSRGRG